MLNKRILLVNPLSSAKYLSDEFNKYNVFTEALFTIDLNTVPAYAYPDDSLFNKQTYILSNDASQIINFMGNVSYDYVINGSEVSTLIADKLAKHYTPDYANNPDSYLLRLNKFHMHEILAKKHLSYINQFIYDINEELSIIEKYKINYPCFIKPLASMSALGARKINDFEDFNNYFLNINAYKNHNQSLDNKDKFLIAEYIEGDEYIVDTFSYLGNHIVSSIQRSYKTIDNMVPTCAYTDIVKDIDIINKITKYINNVLTTVEFDNGFAHTEVFITKTGDVKLIEINPRISGASGYVNILAQLNGNLSQTDLLLKYVFDIDVMKNNIEDVVFRRVTLFNKSNGSLNQLEEKITQYKTFYKIHRIAKNNGSEIGPKTQSLLDTVGFVILKGHSIEEIHNDTIKILEQDQKGWD